MQNGPAVSEIWLLLSPIRHYFPDCGRLNEPALGSAQQDSHLPRISRAAPIAWDCGWTGCFFRANGIIARQAATPAFGWMSIALHLPCRLLTPELSPTQVVLAHLPHRCSPSSGDHLPLLFVTGYSRMSFGIFQRACSASCSGRKRGLYPLTLLGDENHSCTKFFRFPISFLICEAY